MPYNWPPDDLTVREKIGVGTDTPSERLEVKGNIKLNSGVAVGEFSSDDAFATPSNQSVPTTQAAKTYIDTQVSSVSTALTNKADKGGSSTQDFQVNHLTAQETVTANKFVGDGSGLTGLPGVTQWVNGASGSISYSGGKVGIGTSTPEFVLDASERIRVRQGATPSAGIWFYQTTPASDRAFVGMVNDSQVGFWGNTGANWGLLMDTTSGQVDISKTLKLSGDLSIPNSGGGSALLTAQKYNNESSFKNNNVKLSLGGRGIFFPGAPPLEYEFMLGNTFFGLVQGSPGGPIGFVTNFTKRFSINQNGDLYCAGSKAGFVTDYFVNRVGDTLEQGDVVVISQHPVAYYSGSQNNIPILEVDLTEKAYDTRVCGIVARFVTEQDLPQVEPEEVELPAGVTPELLSEAEQSPELVAHPLQQFAAAPQADASKVQDQQMGMMVTLGAFAHCKVDADIAPIAVGDLLTTSPTKGHAQKVVEPAKAIGAIVGKALASLEKGKGKIPVLVMLQ
jgi:hypothetical protein